MVYKKRFISFAALISIWCCACDKHDTFQPQGGLLPTNYISIKDNAFDPASLTAANGSSFTFLNTTTVALTIMSDDSTTFQSRVAPDSFFFFKPHTATTIPVSIYIPYHCVERPLARGVIVLTQ